MWGARERVGSPTRRRLIAAATALAMALAGCAGGDDPGDADTSPTPVAVDGDADDLPPTPGEATGTATGTDGGEAPDDAAETDGDSGVDGTDGPEDGALAGTPIDLFWQVGDVLAVIGVAAGDELNVRAGPGTGEEVVATLAPLATDVEVVGETRRLPNSLWVEVDAGATTGWANLRYLAFIGPTDDVTSRLLPMLEDGGRGETMLALGEAIAAIQASTDPPSTVTVVDGPSVGDLGELTLDVVGLGDDSVLGVRLHVFGQPEEGGEGFVLKSVEETTLCARGSSPEGLCV